MTDAMNGVDDRTANSYFDSDQSEEINRKVELLEREKQELMKENEDTKERVKKMTIEIEKLKSDESDMKEMLGHLEREIEQSQENKQALESIAKRAVELETDVSRLQHDLIGAMSESEEANKEVADLKKVLEEKGGMVEALEREIVSLKSAKTDSEKKVRELERKIGVLEVKETEEKSKKIRVEEEMRDRIDDKESEINGFKRKVEVLESLIVKNGLELEKSVKEKLNVEEALRIAEEKARAVELKLGEAEKVIVELKDRAVEVVNGTVNEMKGIFDGGNSDSKDLKWPVVVGSSGAIVAAAILIYLYVRRQ